MTSQFKVASILKLLMLQVFYKMKHISYFMVNKHPNIWQQSHQSPNNVAVIIYNILLLRRTLRSGCELNTFKHFVST